IGLDEAAKQRKNAALDASRGYCVGNGSEPRRGVRKITMQCAPLRVRRYDNSNAIIQNVTHSTTVSARSAVLRRSFRKDFPAAVRGEGVYVWDANGKKYLDLDGSAAVNFIGHGVPEISAA